MFPWTLAGCTFGPAFLVANIRKLTTSAILAGMYSGLIITIVWNYIRVQGYRPFGLSMIDEIIPGFIFSLLIILIVNRKRLEG